MAQAKSILVIDDDPVSLQIAVILLDAEGFATEHAESGEDALRLLTGRSDESGPETVLVDLQMPGISGNDLAERIRLKSKAHLIAMSATLPAEAEISSFDGFVSKPLDPEDLKQALTRREKGPAILRPSESTLDLAILAKLRKLMPSKAVREVFAACLSDTRLKVAQMREEPDSSRVRSAAHTIKGGAGMVGAIRIAALAADLEHTVYQPDDLQPRLEELLSACDETERILLKYIEPQG